MSTYITAVHEAGHVAGVFAAAMNLDGQARIVVDRVELSAAGDPHHSGRAYVHSVGVMDQVAIALAGPWAEARLAWGERRIDEVDVRGWDIDRHVLRVLRSRAGGGDRKNLVALFQELGRPSSIDDACALSMYWYGGKLEKLWPFVLVLADELLSSHHKRLDSGRIAEVWKRHGPSDANFRPVHFIAPYRGKAMHSFRMESTDWANVELLAASRGMTTSALVRDALTEYVDQHLPRAE